MGSFGSTRCFPRTPGPALSILPRCGMREPPWPAHSHAAGGGGHTVTLESLGQPGAHAGPGEDEVARDGKGELLFHAMGLG